MPAGGDALWGDDHLCALGTLDPGEPHLEWLGAPGGADGGFDLPSLSDLEDWSPLAPSAPTPRPLRCLDPAHAAACDMCVRGGGRGSARAWGARQGRGCSKRGPALPELSHSQPPLSPGAVPRPALSATASSS